MFCVILFYFYELDIHEVFIRTQNNLLDICPIRIMAFQSKNTFDPVLRVQVKEILEHTFKDVIDDDNKLEINITGKSFFNLLEKKIKFRII
jgi:hypothetical protein